MFESVQMTRVLHNWPLWVAQVPVDRSVNTPEEASMVFSGSQFLTALIAGVVLAFAFQLLLTNASVALGISLLKPKSGSSDDESSGSLGGTIRKIGTGVGIWTLVSVTIALFVACFLAVKLSLITAWELGAIVGVVIWGTYFSLLVWVSSTTVGSLIGSVVNTATSGFQAIWGTAAAALGAKAASSQMVATAEAAAAAVRRELGAGLDPTSLRETVEDYLGALKPATLDLQEMRREFERLLNDPELKSLASGGNLPNLDREKLVELVSSRTDFSKRDINRVVKQLEDAWKQVSSNLQQPDWVGQLSTYLKEANPSELLSDELSNKLDTAVSEIRKRQKSEKPSLMQQAMQTAFTTLSGVVMGRTDMSDIEVEKVLDSLEAARDKLTNRAGLVSSLVKGGIPPIGYNPIRSDVENYLQNAYSWKMNPATIDRDFREVLYDPAADPGTVRQQLEELSRADFEKVLGGRGVFTRERIKKVSAQLENIRLDVLSTVQAAEVEQKRQQLWDAIENYLRWTPLAEMTPEGIQKNLKPLIEDQDAGYEELRDRLSQLDRTTFIRMLKQRNDINRSDAEQILTSLENTRDRVLFDAQALDEKVKAQATALQQKVEKYLQNTGKEELNPEGIKRDLSLLLNEPQTGIKAIGNRLSRFDRDTVVKLLSQREDLSEEDVNRIVDRVEETWDNVLHAPQIVASKAKEEYDKLTTVLGNYLRNTGKEELNPEGIKRDLRTLVNNPKEGIYALRDRLAQVDRETLVKLLSQREDLSEEQVNQTIDMLLEGISSIVKAPRRLARRVQQQAQDFQGTLEDYLRNTGKEELNPEAIKRDLQLLVHDPKAGVESLGDRLRHFDRSTIVSLLSQRPDISEEEANGIVDQVLSVRDSVMLQIQNIQNRIQGVVEGILAKIRNYLNSLDRPELNYDGIKRDVRQLFDDPEAGFDSLRLRLSQFNRDTLVAVLSSREDISEADANRIIDSVEKARNSVLQRAERLQQEAQLQVEKLKQQAQRQVEETRKAAASAAWWLLGTGVSSLAASAAAGAIAVGGF